jgi:hypothetical protein
MDNTILNLLFLTVSGKRNKSGGGLKTTGAKPATALSGRIH